VFSTLFEACSCGIFCCSARTMCYQMLLNQGMSRKAPYSNDYNFTFSLNEILKMWKETVRACCEFDEIVVETLTVRETYYPL
jgi:hypothetical protein